jgi:hypothetical protein
MLRLSAPALWLSGLRFHREPLYKRLCTTVKEQKGGCGMATLFGNQVVIFRSFSASGGTFRVPAPSKQYRDLAQIHLHPIWQV